MTDWGGLTLQMAFTRASEMLVPRSVRSVRTLDHCWARTCSMMDWSSSSIVRMDMLRWIEVDGEIGAMVLVFVSFNIIIAERREIFV